MAGFGCINPRDSWQPGDFEPVPGVVALGGQSKLHSPKSLGRMVWRPAAHPLHLNQKSCGFGLGLPFAKELRALAPDRAIGLIPCAWGGAAIEEIHRGTPLFGNAVKRAKRAMEVGRLRAVLWHQGESDARSRAMADAHALRLRQFLADLREELDVPKLPFLIGDLAEFTEEMKRDRNPKAAEFNAIVRAGLRQVATEDPHSSFVESKGLSGADDVHFGRESLIEFGSRYARAWLELAD
jgi:hypothetical protein